MNHVQNEERTWLFNGNNIVFFQMSIVFVMALIIFSMWISKYVRLLFQKQLSNPNDNNETEREGIPIDGQPIQPADPMLQSNDSIIKQILSPKNSFYRTMPSEQNRTATDISWCDSISPSRHEPAMPPTCISTESPSRINILLVDVITPPLYEGYLREIANIIMVNKRMKNKSKSKQHFGNTRRMLNFKGFRKLMN